MKNSFALTVTLLFLLTSFAFSSDKKNVQSTKEIKAQAPTKTILFFRNPNGTPCQQQLAILEKIGDSLKTKAKLEFVSTTVPSDIPKFEQWGIRGLPLLIIIDAKGKELVRLNPGVQSAETILQKLK